jgi:hypothetical protein
MVVLGMGLNPAGISILGWGYNQIADSTTVKLFRKADGSYGNVSALDYSNGDYLLDPITGIPTGENSVQQMVALACKTSLNSSCLQGFGIDISSIKTITDNISQKFELAIRAAVKHMTDRKLIDIINVSVSQIKNQPGAIGVTFKWLDRTNGETNLYKLL